MYHGPNMEPQGVQRVQVLLGHDEWDQKAENAIYIYGSKNACNVGFCPAVNKSAHLIKTKPLLNINCISMQNMVIVYRPLSHHLCS